MSLVADDELVRGGVEVAPVAREPRVGLDRDRVRARQLLALLDRVDEPLAVALGRQLAVELGDEQAAVGEDQDTERARGLDEAGGGDRLARGSRVAEAVAPARARIAAGRRLGQLELLQDPLEVDAEVFLLFVGLDLLRGCAAVAVQLGLDLGRGDQLGQHSRERVDLVASELGARGEARRFLAQHPLEAEHQRVADLPAVRRLVRPFFHLCEGVVERAPAGGSGREDYAGVLFRVEEGLPGPGFGLEGGGG